MHTRHLQQERECIARYKDIGEPLLPHRRMFLAVHQKDDATEHDIYRRREQRWCYEQEDTLDDERTERPDIVGRGRAADVSYYLDCCMLSVKLHVM